MRQSPHASEATRGWLGVAMSRGTAARSAKLKAQRPGTARSIAIGTSQARPVQAP